MGDCKGTFELGAAQWEGPIGILKITTEGQCVLQDAIVKKATVDSLNLTLGLCFEGCTYRFDRAQGSDSTS